MAAATNGNFRPFTPLQFLQLGLELRGFQRAAQFSHQAQELKFRSIYGTSSEVISTIWCELQTNPYADDRIEVAVTQPKHILLTYRWMKSYESELELHTAFDLSENTIRKHVKIVVQKIALLRKIKVHNASSSIFLSTVTISHHFSLL